MIYDQRVLDGECAMVMGTASLLNAHVFSSKTAGFYNVYEKHGPGRYDTWQAFTHTFYSEDAKRWHEATGDFWGGIMQRYTDQGSWPEIRELFHTGVVHRFQEIPEDDLENWRRLAAGRHVPRSDPRHEWGSLIYQAYHEDTVHPIKLYHAQYPKKLRDEMHNEEATIQAQYVEAPQESIEESNREQLVREGLETHENLLEPPDFIREMQTRKEHLLSVIREGTQEKIAYECREHIRRMSHLWESMTPDQKAMYEQWHATNIKERA
jgi:hypothetical protein